MMRFGAKHHRTTNDICWKFMVLDVSSNKPKLHEILLLGYLYFQ